MRLPGYDAQVLTIERSSFGDPGTPGDEDLLLNVSVVVGGYAAADQAWVVVSDWDGFINDLRRLEEVRRGQARLRGASPDDLELTFKAIDLAGHMAVSGFVGWNRSDGFYQKLEFGFAFDPGLLGTVVGELTALRRQSA